MKRFTSETYRIGTNCTLPQKFNAYPLWGCDKQGSCLVGASANRIESVEKVLAFSLVEHH